MKEGKLSVAMLVNKVQLQASVRLWRFILGFSAELAVSDTPPPPATKQKVNFDLDLVTYFLFSVRGLVSYQDEAKCQDGSSAARRPLGCQSSGLSANTNPGNRTLKRILVNII